MVERFFKWTCSYCGDTVELRNYGLPDGWVYIKTIGNVPHACPNCYLNLPEGTKTSDFNWKDKEFLNYEI